jgi:hypothetical protein
MKQVKLMKGGLLLDNVKVIDIDTVSEGKETLLEINNLKTYYPVKGGFLKKNHWVC